MSLKDPKNQKHISDFQAEHAPLVSMQVAKLRKDGLIPHGIEDEDLHSHGFHGLMDALSRYSSDVASRKMRKEGENTFIKYANRRIRGKILDHVASLDKVPKVARTQAKNLAALKEDEGGSED